MNIAFDLFRRECGSTGYMLQIAEKLVVQDEAYVFVICANRRQCRIVQARFREQIDGSIAGSKVYPARGAGQASFETPATVQLDWHTGTVVGAHPSCKVLVDHYAVEQHLGWAVHQWLQYRLME